MFASDYHSLCRHGYREQGLYYCACFCCDTGPQVRLGTGSVEPISGRPDTYAFFCYGSNDDGTLHVSLVVDNNTGIVLCLRSAMSKERLITHLEVEEDTVSPPPSLALANDHHGHR